MWVKILIENAVVLLLVHFVINFIYLFIWIDWIELFYECGLFIWSFLSTASDFGLFLADDDAKKGVWLEAGRSLEYYLLRNGVCMQYAAAHITFDHSSSGFLYCCFNGNFYLSVTMNYLVDIVFLQQCLMLFVKFAPILVCWYLYGLWYTAFTPVTCINTPFSEWSFLLACWAHSLFSLSRGNLSVSFIRLTYMSKETISSLYLLLRRFLVLDSFIKLHIWPI